MRVGGVNFAQKGVPKVPPVNSEAKTHTKTVVLEYNRRVLSGSAPNSKWIFAAAQRFERDLARSDLRMNWDRVQEIAEFCETLPLVGDYAGEPFVLHPWQLWTTAQLLGWEWQDGTRRTKTAILQVARGNGKTTYAAALALWEFLSGPGRRVHVIANKEAQALLCVDTARQMLRGREADGVKVLYNRIEDRERDCVLSALKTSPTSLDGLTPSMWIGDEVAEFADRDILAKLETTAGKRRNSLGLIISTPAADAEGLFAEKVAAGQRLLSGEDEDDSTMPLLFGIDKEDDLGDDACWAKANPGMEHGQPNVRDLKTMWNAKKGSAIGRAEFSRYICARTGEETGNWLDMAIAWTPTEIDWAALRGRRAWVGLDLSKSLDLSALVVAVPLDDGRVALRGNYWWPSEDVRQRELDYRLPVRNWAAKGHVELTVGREIDYTRIMATLEALAGEFQIASVAYDKWGAKMFAEQAVSKGLPLETYSQGIATMGPGCQLFQQLWVGRKFVVGDDPILRNACAVAVPIRDTNGNIKVNKSKRTHIIDPLVAAIMAVHAWGGETASSWEFLRNADI